MSNLEISSVLNKKDIKPMFYHDKCDKYDYLIAVACGAIAGMIDIFLVGAPGDSVLGNWTDEQTNKVVMKFAKKMGWKPKSKNENNVKSAIGFLEREKSHKINYDQRKPSDVNDAFNIAPGTHHMMSLGHSPDPIGLFFSILNQFTSTSSFIADGKLVTVSSETFELQGGNFVMKILCGIGNWIFHLISDVAGGSGADGRGSGIVMPFYELFGACKFGSFSIKDDNGKIVGKKDLSEIATTVFTKGYDFRFGMAMSIPVVVCDLSIRLIWAIKHYFYHKRPMSECIPNKRHDDLRMMLIIGNATLCLLDGADAAIRSCGKWIDFFLRINLVAWYRLATLVLRELCIRVGISFPLQKQLDAYIRINEALAEYLSQLKQIDIERFKKETEQYNELLAMLENTDREDEIYILLRNEYEVLGIPLPYEGDFDDFMNDELSVLEFK